MAIKYKKDYVISDKSMLGTEFFIGTKNLIFTYPMKSQEGGGKRTVRNHEYLINGENPAVYFRKLLDHKKTTLESLETELQERVNDFDQKDSIKCQCKRIEEHKYFKVTSSLLSSSLILTNKKYGLSKFVVTPLGKEYKNDIKEFYKNSLKL